MAVRTLTIGVTVTLTPPSSPSAASARTLKAACTMAPKQSWKYLASMNGGVSSCRFSHAADALCPAWW